MPFGGSFTDFEIIGTATGVNLAAIADTAITISAPSPGTWGIAAFMAYALTGTPTSHVGAFFTATGGGGTNLGALNLSSLTTAASRGFFGLAVSPTAPTTIYFRTTTPSGVASTCSIVIFGLRLP